MTDRGPVDFDAKRDMGIARQVPLEAFRRFDNDVRIRHGQGADQRIQNLATHAERQQMMREWIAVHGSHDQRERLAAGVLPFEEFVDALTDVAFRPLSHLPPYQTDGATRLQEQLRQLPRHADATVTPTSVGRHASPPDRLSASGRWSRRFAASCLTRGCSFASDRSLDRRPSGPEGPTGDGPRDISADRSCDESSVFPTVFRCSGANEGGAKLMTT